MSENGLLNQWMLVFSKISGKPSNPNVIHILILGYYICPLKDDIPMIFLWTIATVSLKFRFLGHWWINSCHQPLESWIYHHARLDDPQQVPPIPFFSLDWFKARGNLQETPETPIFHGKNPMVSCRFSLNPIRIDMVWWMIDQSEPAIWWDQHRPSIIIDCLTKSVIIN